LSFIREQIVDTYEFRTVDVYDSSQGFLDNASITHLIDKK